MKAAILIILINILYFISSSAQSLKGIITDRNGETIPYATIFIKELNMGTTSNGDGRYELNLQPGNYNLQFRSMGFQELNIKVEIDSNSIQKNIVLQPQVFTLREIRVYKGDEDPAYPIIRRAISLAPYYLNQVKEYKADVYIKGTAKLVKVPKFIRDEANVDISGIVLKEGDMFVGESFSEINFEAPDRYYQKIVSSSLSKYNKNSQTFDIGLVTTNPYQPLIGDNMVMPLAPQAFSHYKFRYEGYFTEGSYLINKIRVIPKRKSKQLFSGYLYIVDGLWCFNGLELETDQIFGTMHFDVQFGEISPNTWMPISHAIKVDASIMGVKGKATYSSSVKYNSFTLNTELERPAILDEFIDDQQFEKQLNEEITSKLIQQIDALMNSEELSKREAIKVARMMKKAAKQVEPDTLKGNKRLEIAENYHKEKKDSTIFRSKEYWEKMRPNPLTLEELQTYKRNDSLALAEITKKDSIVEQPAKPGKKKIAGKIIGKKDKSFKGDSIKIGLSSLIDPTLISFNAVEGWKYKQKLSWEQLFEQNRRINASVWGAYAFGLRKMQWEYSGTYQYAPLHFGKFNFAGGNTVVDYAGDLGISPFVNSVSSLFFKENYARYSQQKYISVSNSFEIFNGMMFHFGFAYAKRYHLENSTNFSIIYWGKDYQPNTLYDFNGLPLTINNETTSSFSGSLEYTPNQFYRIKNGIKQVEYSGWPTFILIYEKGVNGILNSTSDWDYIEFGIKQQAKVGLFGQIDYAIKAGKFVSDKHIGYADYAQINTSLVPIETSDKLLYFKLLPYYSYNTNRQFVQAGFNFETPHLFLKYLPWLSERNWKENLSFNYLSLPGFLHYLEAGYRLSNLLISGGSVGMYSSFENGHYTRTAVRAIINF